LIGKRNGVNMNEHIDELEITREEAIRALDIINGNYHAEPCKHNECHHETCKAINRLRTFLVDTAPRIEDRASRNRIKYLEARDRLKLAKKEARKELAEELISESQQVGIPIKDHDGIDEYVQGVTVEKIKQISGITETPEEKEETPNPE